MRKYFYILLIIGTIACESSEEILVDLPQFNEELVVECYLQDGIVPRAFLSQSVGYFENKPIAVNEATFEIIAPSQIYKLKNQVKEDQDYPKFYNYIGEDTMNIAEGDVLKISIKDKLGRTITGSTSALAPVKIDSVSYSYNNSGQAFPVIHFYDDPKKKNYYRYTLKKEGEQDLKQDFVFDDYLLTQW